MGGCSPNYVTSVPGLLDLVFSILKKNRVPAVMIVPQSDELCQYKNTDAWTQTQGASSSDSDPAFHTCRFFLTFFLFLVTRDNITKSYSLNLPYCRKFTCPSHSLS